LLVKLEQIGGKLARSVFELTVKDRPAARPNVSEKLIVWKKKER
jgi:hypothetical protein